MDPDDDLERNTAGAEADTQSQNAPQQSQPGGPWMVQGYPAFSRWMASADDFMVLRRFGVLNTRVILLLQNDLVKAERELFELDKQAQGLPTDQGRCDIISDDNFPARSVALRSIVPMLEQYSMYRNMNPQTH